MTNLELILALFISAFIGGLIMYFYNNLVDRSNEEIDKESEVFVKYEKQIDNNKQDNINNDKVILNIVKKDKIKVLEDENLKLKQDIEDLKNKIDSFFEENKKKIKLNSKVDKINNNDNNTQELKEETKYYKALIDDLDIDNLQIIDGIGPKIESILKDNKITNLRILSKTKPEKIKYILDTVGGEKYSFHNPSSWPTQAKVYLEKGKEDLEEYKEFLRAKKLLNV